MGEVNRGVDTGSSVDAIQEMIMPKKESSSDDAPPIVTTRSKPAEGQLTAVIEGVKNLSAKAIEKGTQGGVSLGYESGVDDFRTNVPSRDKRMRHVDEALLNDMNYYREELVDLAKSLDVELDVAIDEVPKKGATYQEAYHWIDRLNAPRFGVGRDTAEEKDFMERMGEIRALLKKQATIDILDDTDAFRRHAFESRAPREEMDEFEESMQ